MKITKSYLIIDGDLLYDSADYVQDYMTKTLAQAKKEIPSFLNNYIERALMDDFPSGQEFNTCSIIPFDEKILPQIFEVSLLFNDPQIGTPFQIKHIPHSQKDITSYKNHFTKYREKTIKEIKRQKEIQENKKALKLKSDRAARKRQYLELKKEFG